MCGRNAQSASVNQGDGAMRRERCPADTLRQQSSLRRTMPNVVIPAKAGIHLDLAFARRAKRNWIPTFAGMTTKKSTRG
jgi:hypothetical protein